MKVKNNFQQNFNYLTTTSTFKIFLLLMILINIYVSSCTTINLSYFESLMKILYYPYYHIVFFLLTLSIVIKTFQDFKGNFLQIIRYENYSICLKIILKQVVYNISICFLINLLILLTSLNIFHLMNYGFSININGLNIVLYCLFLLIRFYILCIIFSILNFIFLNIFNYRFVLLINLLTILTIPDYFFWIPSIRIGSTNQIPIFYLGFFSSMSFSNCFVELCATTGHIFILTVICYILYNYIISKSKINFE